MQPLVAMMIEACCCCCRCGRKSSAAVNWRSEVDVQLRLNGLPVRCHAFCHWHFTLDASIVDKDVDLGVLGSCLLEQRLPLFCCADMALQRLDAVRVLLS